MAELLLEFFSEEIPARMQKRAEEDLARALGERLKGAGLEPKAIKTFSSARRLGAMIDDLPAKAADVNEEKKGPRVGAPDQAIQGFLKSAGLKSIGDAQVVEDKKGAFYVARIERAGRALPAIVQEIVPDIVRSFPWPKSMRSGESDLTWVRPLHNIMCLFDGAPVKIEIEGVPSKPETWGHRFHAPGAIKPKDFADYAAKLRTAKVLIDREERKAITLEQARKLCGEKKLELVEDVGLLEEVAGLAEWPVVLLGDMDPAFLDLPGEVIRLSMRTHQKYFAVREPKTGKLAPHFVVVANIEAKDGGKAIAAGNARVLSARLNDARFFWETDLKTPLYTEERKAKLEKLVFHQKLGSVWDKVERVKALAVELCAVTGADKALVEEAATLCKMDLVTETVGEFPELQGQVGRALYETSRGKQANASIAAAIEDHYRPLGPNDRVPSDPVAVTLALADKLDTLVGFWAIDEKPTGSSDPYALRRAALGLVRIVLHNNVRFTEPSPPLRGRGQGEGGRANTQTTGASDRPPPPTPSPQGGGGLGAVLSAQFGALEKQRLERLFRAAPLDPAQRVKSENDLLAFLADRLKVQLREQGKRHDLVDAVFAPNPETKEVDDDLVRIVARVEALDAFLKTEDGANLLAGYKRAANIIAAEEKKGKWSAEDASGEVDPGNLPEMAERALSVALAKALPAAQKAVAREEFGDAMRALSALRGPVDAFFDQVLVNAEDAALRRNRLLLLTRFVQALSAVADFSKIEG
ncbi:MAG: glycine--tRNA ligase subunit beta [Hyphomonadaceae bacterium]